MGGGILFLLAVALIIPASSTWIYNQNDSVSGTISGSGIGVGDSSEAGEKTCVIANYNDGTGKTAEISVSNGQISEPTAPTDNDYHSFMGWYTTRNGVDKLGNSTLISFPFTPSYNYQEIYARYKTLNDLSANLSDLTLNSNYRDYSNYYYLGTSDGDSTMYIDSITNIQVRYSTGTGTSDGVFNLNNAATSSANNAIEALTSAHLIVKLDCDLVIDGGTLQLNSLFNLKYDGATQFVCQISGGFTCLDLNGYTLTITNGGIFNAYGIVYNSQDSGGIVNEDGTIYTAFSIIDYKGSGKLCLGYAGAVTPFFLYCIPYLTCEVVTSSMGYIKAFTALFAYDISTTLSLVPKVYTTNFTVIGNSSDAILSINRGYCIKRATSYDDLIAKNGTSGVQAALYDTDFRETLVFTDDVEGHLASLDVNLAPAPYCEVDFNPMTLSISAADTTVNVSFKYFDFPIASFYDIELYNTRITISFSLVIMPGANVYVDEDSIVKMTNIAGNSSTSSEYALNGGGYRVFGRISVLDKYPVALYKFKQGDNSYNNSSNSEYNNEIYMNIVSDIFKNSAAPKVTMNGVFTFDSNQVRYDNLMGHYYTIGGHIDCSKQAIESLNNDTSRRYIELVTRFYFPGFFSMWGVCAYRFYNLPLISNGVAYFQPSGRGSSVVAATSYNEVDGVYTYNNSHYYYQYRHDYVSGGSYSEPDSTSGDFDSGALSVASKAEAASATGPIYENYKAKMEDLAGCFVKANSYVEITDGTNTTSYISDGTNYLVNVAGAWCKVTSAPTSSFSDLTLTSNTKGKLVSTMPDFSMSSTVVFNKTVQKWGLGNAS